MSTFDQRGYQRERKLRLKAKGLCQDCGQTKPEEGRTMCERCLQNRIRAGRGLPRLNGLVRPHRYRLPGKPPGEDTERLDRLMALAEKCA